MKAKLTDDAACYAARQPEKGGAAPAVAEELGATQRHVQKLRAEHLRTGEAHERRSAGPTRPSRKFWRYRMSAAASPGARSVRP